MKVIVFVKKGNETVKSLTFIGCLIQKILRRTSIAGFLYGCRMLYEYQASEYRPTILGLFFHLLKFIFGGKKSLHASN
jgi:hypothetical protein